MVQIPIDAKTGLLGLLGNPVGHSLSPVIHGELAKHYHKNYAYLAFAVEREQLQTVVQGAKALQMRGMNVTVPHKQAIMEHLTKIDEKAQLLGAVNTLVATENGYKGYNTDMPGLQRAMASDGVDVENRSVVLIGAGGVANAVLGVLAEGKAKQVLILNRTRQRAEKLAEHFKTVYPSLKMTIATYDEDYLAVMEQLSKEPWIAVQATSVGMHPAVEDAPIEDPAFYKHISQGYDMIFNPSETKFMKLIKEQGGQAFNGLKMLLFQGIKAFELWMDLEVSDEIAKEVLEALLLELEAREKETK